MNNLSLVNSQELAINATTMSVLKDTLYPGAKDESIQMVINYCKAKKLNPLLKPVHLVPMNVKTGKKDGNGKDIYESRDVVMPGIGQYRIDAARSNQYAGMSEPEFGEEITEEFISKSKDGKSQSVKVTYPKWCKITVKKLLPNGLVAFFTAKEYWKENYATKSRWDSTPNEMWQKRGYGQIAKCTEAQVLRKAFPDEIGNEYTKEEMEGKIFSGELNTKTLQQTAPIQLMESATLDPRDIQEDVMEISWAQNLTDLQHYFTESYKYWVKAKHKENIDLIIQTKNTRKMVLEEESKVNPETGEVTE